MGQFIDLTQEIEDNCIQEQDFEDVYEKNGDYNENLNLFAFIPDIDFVDGVKIGDFFVMATCLQEAMDMAYYECDAAISMDDWTIIKYPIERGLMF